MNPPKLDVCIEGYNIEQTDYYIGSLIEKNSILSSVNQKNEAEIKRLQEENKLLKDNLPLIFKRFEGLLAIRLDRIEAMLNRIESSFGLSDSVEEKSGKELYRSEQRSCDATDNDVEIKEKLSEIRKMLDSLNS